MNRKQKRAFYLEIAQNIRKRRLEMGASQDTIAKALHLTHGSYTRIEYGESNIKADSLVQLAYLFGCAVDDLIPKWTPR